MDKEKEVNGKPIELPRRTRKLPQVKVVPESPTTLKDGSPGTLQQLKTGKLGKSFPVMSARDILGDGATHEVSPTALIASTVEFKSKSPGAKVALTDEHYDTVGSVETTIEKPFKVPKKIPIDTMGDWMESMYILLGCVLNKLGQKGIELTARDLEKFDATRSLKYSKSANGKLSYQVVKKPKGEAQ